MTSIKDFTNLEKLYLFIGAILGYVIGFIVSPQHQDGPSRKKAGIYQIVGALIGFGIVYLWMNYKHKK